MIDDGKATITIKELDELRDANKKWKDYWEIQYRERLQELERREEIIKEKASEYLVANVAYNRVRGEYYSWLTNTKAYNKLKRASELYFYDIEVKAINKFIKTHSLQEIRRRKRELK